MAAAVHPKVRAGGLAGLVVTAVVLVAAQFGYTVDPALQALLTTLVIAIAGYFTPAVATA